MSKKKTTKTIQKGPEDGQLSPPTQLLPADVPLNVVSVYNQKLQIINQICQTRRGRLRTEESEQTFVRVDPH